MNHIIGIIGEQDTTAEMIDQCLTELKDAADEEGEAFWAIVGLTEKSPDAIAFILDWLIANEVAYDIVVESAVKDKIPEEYRAAADKINAIKDVAKKVVDRLLEEESVTLCGLFGNDGDSSDDIMKAAARFADIEGNRVLAIDDANNEVNFGADVTDNNAEPTEPDYPQLGEEAEGGDEDAQTALTEAGTAAGIDQESMDGMTWLELAEAIEKANKPKPGKAAGASKAAASKGTTNKWTAEALEAKTIVELRTIATQSGVEGAKKMGLPALVTALTGKPIKGAEPEEAAAEAPAVTAKRGKAAAAKTGDRTAADVLGEIAALFVELSQLG